jgi:hypothetical protein
MSRTRAGKVKSRISWTGRLLRCQRQACGLSHNLTLAPNPLPNLNLHLTLSRPMGARGPTRQSKVDGTLGAFCGTHVPKVIAWRRALVRRAGRTR